MCLKPKLPGKPFWADMLYLLLLLPAVFLLRWHLHNSLYLFIFCNYFTYCSFWCINCICVLKQQSKRERKIKNLRMNYTLFFARKSGWHIWGEIMGKGAESERSRGAIYDMRTTLLALEGNVHRGNALNVNRKCVSEAFFCCRRLFPSQRPFKMQSRMESIQFDLRAISKSSFPSIASPTFVFFF